MQARRAICYIETRTFAESEDGKRTHEDTFGVRLPCRVRTDGDVLTVSYTERGDACINTRIEYTKSAVLLTRRGDACFSVCLQKGKPTPAPYSIGAYALDTVCTLEDYRLEKEPLLLFVAYRMEMDGICRYIELTVREETAP